MRLDQYCAKEWPEYSRSVWQKRIALGGISVNGQTVISASSLIKDGDDVARQDGSALVMEQIDIPVLYEDDNVVVINKPAGMLSHAKGAMIEEYTVADFFKPKTTYNSDTNRPGIIHRLDRDTSGVMIGAKNTETAKSLIRQFQARSVKKLYAALLDGIPKQPEAIIQLPIGRNPKLPSQFRVSAEGKPAKTHYVVVDTTDRMSLVKLAPYTGRTHQLRVHMAYINTPIRGDRVYGKPASRLFLHATSLEVTIPNGQRKVFESEIPDEFPSELHRG